MLILIEFGSLMLFQVRFLPKIQNTLDGAQNNNNL